MTELSLSAINARAPYRLRKSELGGFDFDVDAGLTYNVTNYLGAFLRKDNELYDAFCATFEQFDRDIHKDEPWNINVTEY